MGRALATRLQIPVATNEQDANVWLAELARCEPTAAANLIVETDQHLVASAVASLLKRGSRELIDPTTGITPPVEPAGRLLLRITERGHGLEGLNPSAVEGFGRFLIGLGLHLTYPESAQRNYSLAS